MKNRKPDPRERGARCRVGEKRGPRKPDKRPHSSKRARPPSEALGAPQKDAEDGIGSQVHIATSAAPAAAAKAAKEAPAQPLARRRVMGKTAPAAARGVKRAQGRGPGARARAATEAPARAAAASARVSPPLTPAVEGRDSEDDDEDYEMTDGGRSDGADGETTDGDHSDADEDDHEDWWAGAHVSEDSLWSLVAYDDPRLVRGDLEHHRHSAALWEGLLRGGSSSSMRGL